jgi:hypothetical protein
MAAREVWGMRAAWAQRRKLAQEITADKIHYAWLGQAACGHAPTGAELTALASLVTCPGCKTMSVWAMANLAEVSREVSIVMTTRLGAAMAALGRAFGGGKPPASK